MNSKNTRTRHSEDFDQEPDPLAELIAFLRAVHVMKLFAASRGIRLTASTRKALCAIAPIEQAITDGDSTLPPQFDVVEALELTMAAHASMAKAVSPATPDSIRYTEPPRTFRQFYRRQSLLFALIVAAVIAVIGYMTTLIASSVLDEPAQNLARFVEEMTTFEEELGALQSLQYDAENQDIELSRLLGELETRSDALEQSADDLSRFLGEPWPAEAVQLALLRISEQPVNIEGGVATIRQAIGNVRRSAESRTLAPRWIDVLMQHLKNLFAATLGAAFYTLYTAHTYVVNRTFDRAYMTHYVVRFVLGIVAGTVLANFGDYLITGDVGSGSERPSLVLTQTVLALIGGYSADAVNSIFTRFAETLTTLVKGESKQEAKAEIAAAKAENSAAAGQWRQAEISRLQSVLAVAVETNAPQEVIESLRSQIEALSEEGSEAG